MVDRTSGRVLAMLALLCTASVAGAQRAKPAAQSSERAGVAFVGGVAAGAWSNRYLDYRHAARPWRTADAGGDRWTGADKALHASGSFALTIGGIRAGVRPVVAAAGVCAGGLVLEATQVRISGKDVMANCTGAAGAWLTARLFNRK